MPLSPPFAPGTICKTVVSTQAGEVHILVKVLGPLPTMKYSTLLVVADEQTGQEYIIEQYRLEPYQKP